MLLELKDRNQSSPTFVEQSYSRGVRSLSSLPRLRFSSHRGKFEENKMAAAEVSPRAYAPILLSGTVGLQLSATKAIKLKAFHNFTAMCSTGFEKVSHKDASIRLWKSSPGRLIGTCHLTWTVTLLTRTLVPI